jgi:hypothetical protein
MKTGAKAARPGSVAAEKKLESFIDKFGRSTRR